MSTTQRRRDAVVVIPTFPIVPPKSFRKTIDQIVMRGFKRGESPEALAQAFLRELQDVQLREARKRHRGIGPIRLPTQAITNSFKLEILDGIHVPGDTYKIALYVSATTIGAGTTAYTATNEVANGNGYTTGGQNLTGRSAALDGSTAVLDFADAQWATSTITARGAMIYNSTKANRSVCVLDFGADIISTNGNFNVVFPAATAAAGLVRIA